MNTYVLIAVLVWNGYAAAAFTQEFSSEKACEIAKERVRTKTAEGRWSVLTCEKK